MSIRARTITFPGLETPYEFPVNPEDVGAAPAGFGLGGSQQLDASTNIDNVCRPGWYCWEYTMTIGGVTANYWHMRVSAYGTGSQHCIQEIFPVLSSGYCRIVRRKNAGVWGESDVENPPMNLGVEYRTTERHGGKAVYVKRISFGKLPASGSSNVSTGISGTLVSLTATFYSDDMVQSYPLIDSSGTKCISWISKECTKLWVQSISDCSAYTGEFIIKYTK